MTNEQPIDIAAELAESLVALGYSSTGALAEVLVPIVRDLMDRAAAMAVAADRKRVIQLVRIFEENAQASVDLHTRQAQEHMAEAAEYAGRVVALHDLAAELADSGEEVSK